MNECFWWGNTQNNFWRKSKLTLKIKWYLSCGCYDDSRSCKKLKKRVTDKYFEKKATLWTLITFRYRKYMLPLQHLSDWCLHGVYVWQKFRRKNISSWVIIWIKLKVLCFGYFKSSTALWLPLDPSCKRN